MVDPEAVDQAFVRRGRARAPGSSRRPRCPPSAARRGRRRRRSGGAAPVAGSRSKNRRRSSGSRQNWFSSSLRRGDSGTMSSTRPEPGRHQLSQRIFAAQLVGDAPSGRRRRSRGSSRAVPAAPARGTGGSPRARARYGTNARAPRRKRRGRSWSRYVARGSSTGRLIRSWPSASGEVGDERRRARAQQQLRGLVDLVLEPLGRARRRSAISSAVEGAVGRLAGRSFEPRRSPACGSGTPARERDERGELAAAALACAAAIAGIVVVGEVPERAPLAVLLAHEEERRQRGEEQDRERDGGASAAAAGRRRRGCRSGRGSGRRRRAARRASPRSPRASVGDRCP